MNHIKTFVLLAALTALFVGVGYMIGGPAGMAIAFVIAAGMNLISYWNADKIVLSMYGAQPAEDDPNPVVVNFVRDVHEMADRAGMPRPRVFICDSAQPNAFATGRNPEHAAVCANLGLLRMLNRAEVRAVMAHELGHVKNHDTLTMTITATIAGAVSSLANMAMFAGMFGGRRDEERGGIAGTLLLAVLAPIAAALVQFAISRSREYEADKAGAELSGDPQALASALQKIESYVHSGYGNPVAENNPATAHLFISSPFTGHRMGDSLFSTHPSTANRVAALMQMKGQRWLPAEDPLRPAATVAQGHRPGPWG